MEENNILTQILKNVIGRAKLDKDAIDNAFKLGMSGDEFSIKEKDLSENWTILKSFDSQKRLTKLLGYWANKNFPSLGKKFFERSWTPPKRRSLKVNGRSKEISADQIDAFVSQKLKIRVIQLNVSQSTLAKVQHFVNCPANIGKNNELQISDKVKSFDVDDEWKEECWRALKLGSFSLNGNSEIDFSTRLAQTDSTFHQEIDASKMTSGSGSRAVLKRTFTQVDTENGDNATDSRSNSSVGGICTQNVTENIGNAEDSSIGFQPVPPLKRLCLCIEKINVNSATAKDMLGNSRIGSQSVLAQRRAYRETLDVNSGCAAEVNNDSRIDTIQAVLLDLRKDMGNFTDLFGSTVVDKDKEIARLNSSVHELLHMNQILTSSQSNVKERFESQAALIVALQKGADANSKLLVQSEVDLSTRTHLIDAMKMEITASKNQIQSLSENLVVSENSKRELEDELRKLNTDAAKKDEELKIADKTLIQNEKLQEELNTLKISVNKMLPQFETQIGNLEESLTAAQQTTAESIAQKINLEEELTAVRLQFDLLLSDKSKSDMEVQSLSENLAVSENSKRELEVELRELNTDAAKKDEELKIADKTLIQNEKLQEELNTLKISVNKMLPQFETQIGNLEESLTAAQQTTAESIAQKINLEEELTAVRLQFDLLLSDKSKSDMETQTTYNEVDNSAENEDCVTNDIEPNGCESSESSNNQGLHSEQEFVTKDPIVQKLRPLLLKLQFGWVKFHTKENAKYYPAFIHPNESDGKHRAQEVIADGYVSNVKNIYFDIAKDDDIGKKKTGFTALKKLNNKFGFSFM